MLHSPDACVLHGCMHHAMFLATPQEHLVELCVAWLQQCGFPDLVAAVKGQCCWPQMAQLTSMQCSVKFHGMIHKLDMRSEMHSSPACNGVRNVCKRMQCGLKLHGNQNDAKGCNEDWAVRYRPQLHNQTGPGQRHAQREGYAPCRW